MDAYLYDITPGVRSLHVHYDASLRRDELLDCLRHCERRIPELEEIVVQSRTGTGLQIEWTVEGHRSTVDATVVDLPFFDPPRRRA